MVEIDNNVGRGGPVDIGGPVGIGGAVDLDIDGLDDGRSDLIRRFRPLKCLDGLLQPTQAGHGWEVVMLDERMMDAGNCWQLGQ